MNSCPRIYGRFLSVKGVPAFFAVMKCISCNMKAREYFLFVFMCLFYILLKKFAQPGLQALRLATPLTT